MKHLGEVAPQLVELHPSWAHQAQRGGRCPIPGNIQGWVGRGSEHLALVEAVADHCRRLGLDGLQMLLWSQTILCCIAILPYHHLPTRSKQILWFFFSGWSSFFQRLGLVMQDKFSFGRACYVLVTCSLPPSRWWSVALLALETAASCRSWRTLFAGNNVCSFLSVLGRRCIKLPAGAQGGAASKWGMRGA